MPGISMTPRKQHHVAARSDRELLRLQELLSEVGRRPTRLELVCWQLDVDEPRARPAWELALRMGLVAPAGADRFTGDPVFELTDRGRQALRTLRPTRRR
jgi:hypothetical protein